jgi:hypothetical protein
MRSKTSAPTRFELIEPSGRVLFWIWGLCVVLPLSVTAFALGIMLLGAFGSDPVPAPIATPLFITAIVIGVTVIALPLGIVLQRSLRRLHVGFDGETLELRVAWFRIRLALSEIDVAHARIVNLDERAEYRPSLKTNAFALPGYQAGHFRLRDWRRKAFVLLTSRQRVLVLPLHDRRTVLLSLRQPQRLIDALREAGFVTASGRRG